MRHVTMRCRVRLRHLFGESAVSLIAIGVICGMLAEWQPVRGQAQGTEGPEQVLTRGPIHEAFAAPVVHDPRSGPVVPRQPPAPVEEMPPDQKPAGPNVQWIPGYWSWDQERTDFLWVSGVWREPPPGRQWVPGYWHPVNAGFQWVPGDWVPLGGGAGGPSQAPEQPAYLPAPPQSLETGPSSPAPSEGVFWSPGSWYWQENRYVWRPGFWAAVQPSWVWIPPHFVWTPGGYLFVAGYWDLPLAERGLLFAPVYYPQPVYLQPSYVFTPSITIATPGLVANLFVQPAFGQYCFGDFYDRSFLSVGIFPWFSFHYVSGPAQPMFYDPIFTYYAAVNVSRDPGWAAHVRQSYITRRDNVSMRPPRTFVEQTRVIERSGPNREVVIARSIRTVASHPEEAGGMRLERVGSASRRQWQDRGGQLAQFRDQRTRLERQEPARRPGPVAHGAAGGAPTGLAGGPRRLALPSSPVSAPAPRHAVLAEADGPSGPSDRRTHAQGVGGFAGPRHDRSSPGQVGAPLSHRDANAEDRAVRAGRAPLHSETRLPATRPEGAGIQHKEPVRADLPRLHAPIQDGARQPPPNPRPFARGEPPDRRRGR